MAGKYRVGRVLTAMVFVFSGLVLLDAKPATAHGTCEIRRQTGSGTALGASTPDAVAGSQIWDDGSPFVFNGVVCDNQHSSYDVTVRLQVFNVGAGAWTTQDTVTKHCGSGTGCFASKATTTCNQGATRQWRVRVHAEVGAGGTHSPTDIGGSPLLTCQP